MVGNSVGLSDGSPVGSGDCFMVGDCVVMASMGSSVGSSISSGTSVSDSVAENVGI